MVVIVVETEVALGSGGASGPRVVAVDVTLGLVETGGGLEALTLTGMVVITETELKAVVPLVLGVTAEALPRADVITVEDGVGTPISSPVEVALIRSLVVVLTEEGFAVMSALERSWIVGM